MKKPINLALAIYIAIILSVTLLTMGCEAQEEIIQVQADTSLNKIEWIGFFNYYGVTDQGINFIAYFNGNTKYSN
tara:strand:- start:177 stop:401 length:225 start_codon:yes stop_codon:yes gene_type:complete